MKKILIGALVLFMSLFLVGCEDKVEKAIEKENNNASKSRLSSFYKNLDEDSGIHMEYETTYEGKDIKANLQMKGENTYTKSTYGGTTSTTIIKDDYVYVLDATSKTATKTRMTDSNEDLYDLSNVYENVEGYLDETKFTSGNMEVDGVNYYYEEYADDGNKMRFLFDGEVIKYSIAYTKDGEVKVKYTAFDNKVDNSVFEIPSDYKILEV